MDDTHRKKLRKNQVELIKDLVVGDDLLAALGVQLLTDEMKARIEVCLNVTEIEHK